MSMYNTNGDTICAISTPHGAGAIAIIRLSGAKALEITDSVFKSLKNKNLTEQKAYTIHFGSIEYKNQLIDDVLVSVFKSPKSFTGEDMAEISCHGSVYIQNRILQILINQGARLAKPGEFSMRAFLNGKMDLSQTEAIADLIVSSSETSHKVAMNQMKGGISAELKTLRDELLNFISLIELELDFSEEDVEFADRTQLTALVEKIKNTLEKLVQSFKYGNAIKNGIPIAIIGKPNVGKSTLLNALLKDDKAIVSEIEGTTRDIIEDTIQIQGYLFRFIDTAGIRETTDYVESLGIKKALQNIQQADIVLLLFEPNDTQETITEQISKIELSNKKVIILINKCDRPEFEKNFDNISLDNMPFPIMAISAKTGKNINELEQEIVDFTELNTVDTSEVLLTNVRHYEALLNALNYINRVHEGITTGIYTELLALDIKQALHHMGEVTGEISNDEVLGNIFKNFCIGK